MDQKSPVKSNLIGMLQEHCAVLKLDLPQYIDLSTHGPDHARIHTVQCKAAGKTGTGKASKKQDAKVNAAADILAQLNIPVHENLTQQPFMVSKSITPSKGLQVTVESTTPKKNPIGMLQEYCMSRKSDLPQYSEMEATGPPHDRTFTILCTAERMLGTGTGKTKSLAKTRAACDVLLKLNLLSPDDKMLKLEQPSPNQLSAVAMEQQKQINDSVAQCAQQLALLRVKEFVKTDMKNAFPRKHNKEFSTMHLNLRNIEGKMVDRLHSKRINSLSLTDLIELCDEQHFVIEWTDTDKKGNWLSFLKLNTGAVPLVYSGVGRNMEESRTSALHQAFKELKILTREHTCKYATTGKFQQSNMN